MLWLWIVLGIVAALLLVLFVGGALLPREHSVTCTVTVRGKPADVYAALVDWRALPTWRKEIKKIEELPTRDGWIETSRFGPIALRIEKQERDRLLVTRIADDKLPFGGTWTWKLEPTADGGTRVSTTEDGFIGPPPFRFLSRFVFGFDTHIRAVHRSLAAKFGG
jgi:uncharacterized protein YndB with AHSA1/START domain